MIIGKNNENKFKSQPNFTSNFDERFAAVIKEGEKNSQLISPLQENTKTKLYSDVNSKSEMADKSFAMLQERYNNGLITLEEFTKKCNNLNKIRQK